MTDIHNDVLEDDDFDTVLSPDIDFAGTFSFEKSFLVRGKVSGVIDAAGVLLIDEQARVEADIKADRVIIRGSVKGNITASVRVEITLTGTLEGNVSAPEISMESGCLFNGKCSMTRENAANSL
ncbi:MAG: polymer-forming cytoskeletal protein [Spirochaetaceae bacterium]|jgi:cytoskeletal protein CcmA (bactofilin family)|nr:polymer-forming cytoskeletal protein [Spirochaetaceae bacterium]